MKSFLGALYLLFGLSSAALAQGLSGPVLSQVSCVNPVSLGADPTNKADSAPAFIKAVGTGNVEVCVPPGSYRIGSTIPLPSGTYFHGAGNSITTFFPVIGFGGDLFQVGQAGATSYLTGVTLANFRIYSGQNLASGVGIHIMNAQIVAVLETEVDGMYGAYECDGCINTHFTHANSVGSNSSPGSFGYTFAAGTVLNGNPSEDWVENVDVRGSYRGAITYPVYIEAADGIWFSGHFGFSSGPALTVNPDNAQLTGIHCTPCVFDTATDGLHVMGNTSKGFGNFQLVGSSSIIMSGYGIYIDPASTLFNGLQAPGFLFNADHSGSYFLGAGTNVAFPNLLVE